MVQFYLRYSLYLICPYLRQVIIYQSLMAKVYTYTDNNSILISCSTCQSAWFKAELYMILLDDWRFFNNNLRINYNIVAFDMDLRTYLLMFWFSYKLITLHYTSYSTIYRMNFIKMIEILTLNSTYLDL